MVKSKPAELPESFFSASPICNGSLYFIQSNVKEKKGKDKYVEQKYILKRYTCFSGLLFLYMNIWTNFKTATLLPLSKRNISTGTSLLCSVQYFYSCHGDGKSSTTETHSTDLLGFPYMSSSCELQSQPWLTPAVPPFSLQCSRCWEAFPCQQEETRLLFHCSIHVFFTSWIKTATETFVRFLLWL